MSSIIHEIRNHLAVAIANVEAFRDGVLEPTPTRLDAVLQALGEVELLLREIPRVEHDATREHGDKASDMSDGTVSLP